MEPVSRNYINQSKFAKENTWRKVYKVRKTHGKSIEGKENTWKKVQKIKKMHGEKYLLTDRSDKPMVI